MLKKLRSSLLLKFTSLVFFAFVLLYLLSYALVRKHLQSVMKPEELLAFMSGFNDVCITIALVFSVVFLGVFLVLRSFIGSVTDEIDDIKNYLEEINNKNYEAVLKIEHHLEFLELSLLLKNIVKRLKSKKS